MTQSTLNLCFQQAPASHGHTNVLPSPSVPTVVFVVSPYLSLIGNRLDTPGSPATSGCRSSSLRTGRSGSPRSPPCTHSDRSPGTAGSASPQDHSRRLQGVKPQSEIPQRWKQPKTHRARANAQYPEIYSQCCYCPSQSFIIFCPISL